MCSHKSHDPECVTRVYTSGFTQIAHFMQKNFILWEFPKLKGPICKGKPFSWGASALWKSSGMYILGTIHAEDPLQAKHLRAWHPAHGHQHVRREHRHHAGAGCCASLGSWYFWVWQGKNQKTHIVDRGCTAETMLLRAQLPNSQALSKLSVLCAYGCGFKPNASSLQ